MAWVSGQGLQDGKYTIEQELGEGGFGITYRARDNNGRYVVIKTLNDIVQRRPDFAKFKQDFVNEALRLARCSHPQIVQVDEVIQEGQLWCIVMEYIDGENLGTRIENQGALSEAEALRYIQQIGEALTVVHNNGLLHRDVKPTNIMLRSGKSEAVLIDFGIAREFTPNLTQTHTQILSDGFAPIEQYDKRTKRGAYTDVYALAATLYYLLTVEVPTIAPLRAIGTPLEPPKQINPRISDKVNQAILKGMEVKAEVRPQSMQDWLGLLKSEEAEDYHQQGLEKAKRGRYQEAIEDFNLELRLNPYSAKTYKYRGLARSRLGDNQGAIKDLQIAADLYQGKGQTDDYQDALERIRKLQTPRSSSLPSLPVQLNSEVGVDYTRLRDLLASEQWAEADRETRIIILRASYRKTEGWLREKDIKYLPCTDLRTIDQLWVQSSKRRFGFSVQKRIWIEVERNCEKFVESVGWCVGHNWELSPQLTYELRAPIGHLPSILSLFISDKWNFNTDLLGSFNLTLLQSFLKHFKACKL